jgi:hypothetical protein
MFRELGRMAVKPPRNEPFPRTGNRSFSRTMAEGETFRDPERIVIAPHRKDLSRSPRTRSRTSTTIMVIREPGREAETPRPRDRFLRPRAQPCRRSRGRSSLLYQTGQCQRSFRNGLVTCICTIKYSLCIYFPASPRAPPRLNLNTTALWRVVAVS